jgi:hypothetical protein
MYKKYKIAIPGKDVLLINNDNYDEMVQETNDFSKKVHLIKFGFSDDTLETQNKIRNVLKMYPNTNRFIVDNFIRMYNGILKDIPGKKCYVPNFNGNKRLISFFRKNNKVVFSFLSLTDEHVDFFMDRIVFKDLLSNVEVIIMDDFQYSELKYYLNGWEGNIILYNKDYLI